MDSRQKLADALEFKFTQGEVLQVYLRNLAALKDYSALETTLFLYPYNPKFNSDHYQLLPYEGYVEDIAAKKRSAYKVASRFADKLFGIFLGLLIVAFFAIVEPADIISVQSVVSILGAYAIGKELWDDFDNLLGNIFSSSELLRWRETPYFYVKNHFGTVERFWETARNKRYTQTTSLPSKFDFITHSNHKTVELLFNHKDLDVPLGQLTRIANFRFNNEETRLSKEQFMLGFKLTLSKNYLLFSRQIELFQLLDKGRYGIVDDEENWQEETLLARSTLTFGRWKFYLGKKLVTDYRLGQLQ